MTEMECPNCKFKFNLDEDYLSGECENCHNAYYYWDHCYDEIENEIYFEGYYWDILNKTN